MTALISDLHQSGKITEIELEPLDQEGTITLASTLWGEKLDELTAEGLFQETEGNPLFVVEVVRSGFLKSGIGATGTNRLPPKVQAVIKTRLSSLSPETRQLGTVAAVIGRDFEFDLLSRAAEMDEKNVMRGLDELWQRRLIREEGEQGYNFSHDKFREIIYQELSPPRRKFLHQTVAAALEDIHQGGTEKIAPTLATHFDQAGESDKAIDYYLEAGDQARRIYARQDAIDYYQRAALLMGRRRIPDLSALTRAGARLT